MQQIEQIGKRDYMEILNVIKLNRDEPSFVFAMAKSLQKSLGGAAFKIYKLYPSISNHMIQVFEYYTGDDEIGPIIEIVPLSATKAKHVKDAVGQGCCLHLTLAEPLTVIAARSSPAYYVTDENMGDCTHLTVVPILNETPGRKKTYVIEIWRSSAFLEVDKSICSSFLVWASVAVQCHRRSVPEELQLSGFELDTIKAILEEMVSLDVVIKRVLQYAQKLVIADRASLFLVDFSKNELVSTVFDLKLGSGDGSDDVEKKEIRIPINRGIAGHVATTGMSMNISDAYANTKFNREVDEATGYKTDAILCMPVKIEGRVIAVVQMVNKREGKVFSGDDEKAFNKFAPFFALGLHHARLYEKISRKEQQYKVALEVLSYHNTCRDSDIIQLQNREPHSVPFDLSDYFLDPFQFDDLTKCQAVMIMFNDLFDMNNFDIRSLTKFILTVKKNYREVPYHNFGHGWSVAQAMYAILKKDESSNFTYKQRLALFVACLCHDLDHRGYTNKYMSETASPLAAMYTTSTMEHHHFNISVTILQQEGHNIFSHFTSEEYKELLALIRLCILATDLAVFFPNLTKMQHILNREDTFFNWDELQHRELAMAISMTASDLSASAKPWHVQCKTVEVIFEEFYDQGDKEKAAGRKPISMMDRNQPELQPASQVGFIQQICIPCYDILKNIIPSTTPLYDMARNNLECWTYKAHQVYAEIAEQRTPVAEKQFKEDVEFNDVIRSYESLSPDENLNSSCSLMLNDSNDCTISNVPSSQPDSCGNGDWAEEFVLKLLNDQEPVPGPSHCVVETAFDEVSDGNRVQEVVHVPNVEEHVSGSSRGVVHATTTQNQTANDDILSYGSLSPDENFLTSTCSLELSHSNDRTVSNVLSSQPDSCGNGDWAEEFVLKLLNDPVDHVEPVPGPSHSVVETAFDEVSDGNRVQEVVRVPNVEEPVSGSSRGVHQATTTHYQTASNKVSEGNRVQNSLLASHNKETLI